MGFNPFKATSRALSIGKTSLLPVIGSVVGSIVPGVGPALGGAIGSAINTFGNGGSLGQVIANSAGNYFGSQIGANLGGAANFGPSGTIASSLGSIGFDSAANVLPASIAGQNIGSALGSFAGSSIGSNVANSLTGFNPNASKPPAPTGITPFTPSQQSPMGLPSSLASFGTLTPNQQSTNIATQGVYGGGEGKDENSYFLNLINRRLVDPSGNVGDTSSLNPIESSYLNQLGLGGYSNSTDLLKKISQYNAA